MTYGIALSIAVATAAPLIACSTAVTKIQEGFLPNFPLENRLEHFIRWPRGGFERLQVYHLWNYIEFIKPYQGPGTRYYTVVEA